MAVFSIAVSQAVLRGIDTTCGCFGADSGPITWLTVLRVIGLGGVSGWLVPRADARAQTIGTQRQFTSSQVSFGAQPPHSAGQTQSHELFGSQTSRF